MKPTSVLLDPRNAATTRSPEIPMNVLVAPAGFKESLEAEQAARYIEAGILKANPHASIRKVPLHDGGEGFSKALVQQRGGTLYEISVTGPIGEPVDSYFGILQDGKTAVVDMAAAAGLRLVPKTHRDPASTTTVGVGELMKAAIEKGCKKLIVGCGDSGTSDGGAGMLQALGVRLLDGAGRELPRGGGGKDMHRLSKIDMQGLHPRLRNGEVDIEVVCNFKNVLTGPRGVARIYGPQKGATPEQVELLSDGLEKYGRIISDLLGKDITTAPGSGASGGLGAGLLLLHATVRTRFEAVIEYFNIRDLFDDSDLLFTAEGGLDSQTPHGKITAEVAKRASEKGIRVVALAGTIGSGADDCYESGIDAFSSILKAPVSLDEAIKNTETLLRDCAENAMRMIMVGQSLSPERQMRGKSPGIGPALENLRIEERDVEALKPGPKRSVTLPSQLLQPANHLTTPV
ncbi:glycerate kinase [Trematosphaeria pertusa]|uniref:Glycerate kinase n=1 Tax=Trematosphaeria pertusa TaxID=390896 RepID=A0A6A6IPD5_9PLEO|nr:glycerate kinase [Trematosphaeria pertusa]KAF2251363.1 glycerate kinase [Trematosphaeria pertusa]